MAELSFSPHPVTLSDAEAAARRAERRAAENAALAALAPAAATVAPPTPEPAAPDPFPPALAGFPPEPEPAPPRRDPNAPPAPVPIRTGAPPIKRRRKLGEPVQPRPRGPKRPNESMRLVMSRLKVGEWFALPYSTVKNAYAVAAKLGIRVELARVEPATPDRKTCVMRVE